MGRAGQLNACAGAFRQCHTQQQTHRMEVPLYDCCCCCCCCCPGGVPTDMIVMAISLARFRCNIYSPVKWLPHVLCYPVLSHPTPLFPTTLNPSMYLLFADGEGGYTGLYMSTTTMFSNSSSRISIYLFIYEINGGTYFCSCCPSTSPRIKYSSFVLFNATPTRTNTKTLFIACHSNCG